MAKPSLAELRARLKQKNENKGNFNENNDVYPHWNIEVDSTVTARILPDANDDNPNFFYVEKMDHKLSINGKDRKVICLQTFGEKCPICELSAKYYKAEGKESVQGKYYYKKKTALLKALILKDPISKDGHESAVGQVKTLQLTNQIIKVIDQQLANEEEETALECVPWDIDGGHNFFIKKTKQGKWDNYTSGTGFAHKVTSIPEDYREAVEAGMVDLSTLLPANPGLEKVQQLLEAHLNGDDAEDEDEEEKPAASSKRRVADEDEEEALPKRRRPADEDEDEAPVAKKRRVVEAEEEEEEVPVKKRKPIVDEDEDEAPVVKKRKPIVDEDEEEEAPAPKKKKVVVEEDEDEDDDEVMKKIRARKKRDTDSE